MTTHRYLTISRLGLPERLAMLAGTAILASLFIPWFSTSGLGRINGDAGDFTPLDTFRWPLVAYLTWCVIASFLGPWVVARGHRLSWTPGEMTIVIGLVGVSLILLNGIILGRPGEPSTTTQLEIGYPIAILGLLTLVFAGLLKCAQSPKARRPPGVASSKQA